MYIDIERLRKDLIEDSLAAFYGGGFGGALAEVGELENASPEELLQIARRERMNLSKYEIR